MKYVIAYDLADDRRRSRLVSLLLDYGARIQESVFFADLEEDLYVEMMERAHLSNRGRCFIWISEAIRKAKNPSNRTGDWSCGGGAVLEGW